MSATTYIAERERDSFERHCRILDALCAESAVSPRIFDVGANVGQSICQYREAFPACTIHAFEANPSAFRQLRQGWGDVRGICLEPIAIAERTGQIPLHATRVPEASSLLPPSQRMMRLSRERKYDHEVIQVQATTLDAYCETQGIDRIDVLKLDIQGAELAALRGGEALLRQGRIRSIYAEAIVADTYQGQPHLADVIAYLRLYNYDIWDISSFLYTRHDRVWALNATYVHREAGAQIEQ